MALKFFTAGCELLAGNRGEARKVSTQLEGATMTTPQQRVMTESARTMEEFSLATVPLGRRCDILGPDVGAVENMSLLDAPVQRRLAELGIRRGMTVTVTQRTSGGGRVIKVGHTRYALDKNTANALRVRPSVTGRA